MKTRTESKFESDEPKTIDLRKALEEAKKKCEEAQKGRPKPETVESDESETYKETLSIIGCMMTLLNLPILSKISKKLKEQLEQELFNQIEQRYIIKPTKDHSKERELFSKIEQILASKNKQKWKKWEKLKQEWEKRKQELEKRKQEWENWKQEWEKQKKQLFTNMDFLISEISNIPGDPKIKELLNRIKQNFS